MNFGLGDLTPKGGVGAPNSWGR